LITGAGCCSTTTGGVGATGSAMVLKTPIELVVRRVPYALQVDVSQRVFITYICCLVRRLHYHRGNPTLEFSLVVIAKFLQSPRAV
jgi:hypothetical protein